MYAYVPTLIITNKHTGESPEPLKGRKNEA